MTKSQPPTKPSKPALPKSGGSYVSDENGDLAQVAKTQQTRKPAVKPAAKEA